MSDDQARVGLWFDPGVRIYPDAPRGTLDRLRGDLWEDLGISTFADCVLQLSAQRFSGYTFEDYGDPAGEQRSAMTADKAEKTESPRLA